MATTGTLIGWLADGTVNPSTGVANASCKAHFYVPGTTTERTVYSDGATSSSISQPLTLDSSGSGEVYTRAPVRIVIKDSTDTTTIIDVDPANGIRAEQVYITNSAVNGGTETTLDAFLTATGGSFYQEGSAAQSRTVNAWLKEAEIQASDYDGDGDDSNDDTAELQALIDRALAASRTGSGTARTVRIHIPEGTWKISAELAAAVSSGVKQVHLYGDGPKRTIIKQYSTSAGGLHFNYSSSTSARTLVEGIGFTCSTTSSGAAFKSTNGNKIEFRNCESGLFRIGFDLDGAADPRCFNCEVVSTDGNSGAIGFDLGNTGRARDCIATGSSSTGTGFKASGTDAKFVDCDGSGWATTFSLAGARSQARGCTATGTASTAHYSVGAANCTVDSSYGTGGTVGLLVGAVSGTRYTNCTFASNTADITLNASATNLVSNGTIDSNGAIPATAYYASTSGAVPATLQPAIRGGTKIINSYVATSGSDAITWSNTSTTGLTKGAELWLTVVEEGGTITDVDFGNQYVAADGNALSNVGAITNQRSWIFIWNGTQWVLHQDDGSLS